MGKTVYLKKANDDVVSYCRCESGLVTWPPQMDCPWCGCGWLFTCVECRKAFVFATGVEVNETLEEIGARDIRKSIKRDPTSEEIASWVKGMQILLKDIEIGREYVYLDGYFIPSDSEAVNFEGWAARHELPHMPQAEARVDGGVLARTIGNVSYWRERQFEESPE